MLARGPARFAKSATFGRVAGSESWSQICTQLMDGFVIVLLARGAARFCRVAPGAVCFAAWGLALLFGGWFPLSTAAQTCHFASPTLRVADGRAFRVSTGAAFASYRNAFGKGEYQGTSFAMAYQHPWIFSAASVAGYRLVRDGRERWGLGDVSLELRGTAYRDADTGFSAGLGLAATLPSGDAERGFGMGHTMLMPGLWMQLGRDRITLFVETSYGRAVGGDYASHNRDGHARHIMAEADGAKREQNLAGSIVQPMNRSEIEHAATLGVLVIPELRVIGRIFGAVPLVDPGGSVREVLALGTQGILGAWDFGLEVQVPVLGSAFVAKTLLTLGLEW